VAVQISRLDVPARPTGAIFGLLLAGLLGLLIL
jgi:hypothetical protein